MPSRLSEEDRTDLVAYLDGELPPEAAEVMEARLHTEPVLRAEAESFRKTWELLEFLPRAEPQPDFTRRTLSRLGPLTTQEKPQPISRWIRPVGVLGWIAATVAVGWLSYGLWSHLIPHEPSEEDLVRDLRIIENKGLYEKVDDFDFLKQLDHPDLFGEETGS